MYLSIYPGSRRSVFRHLASLLPPAYNHRFAFLGPLAEGIPVFE